MSTPDTQRTPAPAPSTPTRAEVEAAQLTAPLRARIAELEATEEGAKVAFGHVVEQKQAAERECAHLRGLLDDAHAQIRRQAELLNSRA